MGLLGWIAMVCAGVATWMWLPPDVMVRLSPPTPLRLPKWAQPAPGAMASKKRMGIATLVALTVIVYGWELSPLVLLGGPPIAAAVWIGLGRFEPLAVRRTRLATLNALPLSLDLVQACLKAGQALRNAIEIITHAMGSPVGEVFGAVTNAISVGLSDEQAWQVLKDDPVVGSMARDLARSSALGTTQSAILAQYSTDLRRQALTTRLAAAKSVGVKAVLPLGVCYLPAFVLIGVVPVIAAALTGLFG